VCRGKSRFAPPRALRAARQLDWHTPETLLEIVGNTGRLVIWVSVVMLMLSQVGMNIAPLIASAGVVGLAIGFGAQELVRDMITGFFMLLENQIRVGDVVTVNGTSGNVERMTMRTVVLRDSTGAVHIFQNGKISTLANLTKDWSAEVMDVGVAYKEDTDRVVEVMRDVAETMQGDDAFRESMLEPIEVFGVDAFKESSVVIKARIKTRPSDQWRVAREYRRRLKKAFEAESIEMPFPHQTIHWGESSPPFKVESASVPAGRPRAASAS
jgi:small-conductance mechanosensitive channel